MQNVAQAYRHTQAGTMGQGEVVVMLYNGALRFLAQAREKIEARDYAAKGILISKALDVINELDSCLNLEAGGELAKNLHQLYFLCNTRLLQANLRLDLAQLDSVVTILTSLKSAFEEILPTPEAQQAAATISAKNAAKNHATTSRPLSTGGQTPGMAPASSVLLQQNMPLGGMPVPPPRRPMQGQQAYAAQGAQGPQGPAARQPMFFPNMEMPKDAARPASQLAAATQAAQQLSAAAQAQPAPIAAQTMAPQAEQSAQAGAILPEAIMPPLNKLPGFAGRKMATYGKLVQGG